MFFSMIMALFIIKLMVSINVSRVNRFIEKFRVYNVIKVFIMEIGMVIVGISMVWVLFRNR